MRSPLRPLLGLLLLLGSPAAAQGPDDITDVLIRVNGPVRLAPAEEAATILVVGHDAAIEGTVREQLVVVNGTARVTGRVLGSVVVAGGRLELGPEASVGRDVALFGSTLALAPGAVVGGGVQEHGLTVSGRYLWIVWVAMTLVLVAAAALFAAVAGRQLGESARLLVARPGETLLAVVVLWVAVPLLTAPLFLTVVGVPLAIAVLLFLLPALWFLGYIVTAAAVGIGLLRVAWEPGRPLLREAAVGVAVLQLAAFMPVVGLALLLIAGQGGAAALVLRAWRGWQARRVVHPIVVQEAYL